MGSHYRYEFLGQVVPEPGLLLLSVVGALAALQVGRRARDKA